jgi:hypothetical protein
MQLVFSQLDVAFAFQPGVDARVLLLEQVHVLQTYIFTSRSDKDIIYCSTHYYMNLDELESTNAMKM